jgi:hypothetical protein
MLRIRDEFGVGSGQRETRLELATSSLEGKTPLRGRYSYSREGASTAGMAHFL